MSIMAFLYRRNLSLVIICTLTGLLLLFYCISKQRTKHLGVYSRKTGDVWSKTWPKVDMKNCSNIVYLNRGINDHNPLSPPRVGVVGLAGSGNTWLRYLIRMSTGIWTGSVYHDAQLHAGGFKAELDFCGDNSTIVIKAHQLSKTLKCPFDKIILLIRDPFHAFLSEFNRRKTNSHTRYLPEDIYNTPEWRKFVVSFSKRFRLATNGWIVKYGFGKDLSYTSNPHDSGKLLLVSFKRLKENPTREMKRVVAFLGLPTFRDHCLKDPQGEFKRVGRRPDIRCVYNGTDTTVVLDSMKSVQDVAQEQGIVNIETEFEYINGEGNFFDTTSSNTEEH